MYVLIEYADGRMRDGKARRTGSARDRERTGVIMVLECEDNPNSTKLV